MHGDFCGTWMGETQGLKKAISKRFDMDATAYSHLFQALANETRMEIISELRDDDMNVSELAEATGREQNSVSYHLKCLMNCGFVTKEANGNERHYSLNGDVLENVFSPIDQHIENHRQGLYTCDVLESEEITE